MRELIQVVGDAFGPIGHPTTTMCLHALDALPAAAAVDAGCGSGLLAQAWAQRWALHVLAVDVDPAAIAQTRAAAALAGCEHHIESRRQPIEMLTGAELAGRVVFANIPISAHAALINRFDAPPAAIVLSGLRPEQAKPIVTVYRDMGLRHVRAMRQRRFDCHVMVGER